jgi:hypothetical protein
MNNPSVLSKIFTSVLLVGLLFAGANFASAEEVVDETHEEDYVTTFLNFRQRQLDNREEFQSRFIEVQQRVPEQRRAPTEAGPRRRAFFESVIANRFRLAFTRLDKAAEKLLEKIEDLEEENNADLTTAKDLVADAKEYLVSAQETLNEAKTLSEELVDVEDVTTEQKAELRTLLESAKADILAAHAALKNAIKNVRETLKPDIDNGDEEEVNDENEEEETDDDDDTEA